MRHQVRSFGNDGNTTVLDGGTGSELRRRGVPLDATTWSGLAPLEHYDTVRAIHADFIAAGADVVTACTFAATRFVLEAAGRGDDTPLVARRAVSAAVEARAASGRDVAIAGSMSCLPPRFDVHAYPDERAEAAAYLELATSLRDAGVDVLLLEMLQDTHHAALACAAARASGLPFWLGVSCRIGARGLVGFDLPLVTLADTLDALLPFGPAAVAVMHSPPAAILPALDTVRARFAGPLGAYPEIGDGSAPASLSPRELAAAAAAWHTAGATIVGGCCGTTPEHVRALAAWRDATAAAESR
jgi:S-methylmethionine-dependent homocysteine/selenocysteine methylase